jgi:DegV family protein with EDD domain
MVLGYTSRVATVVVSDTTPYLPRALAEARGIKEVSLYVTFDGKQVRESEIMNDTDSFYDRLRGAESVPTTSQPSIGDFLEVWEPVLDAGDDVVSIHLASGISGTYDSAVQARAQLVDGGLDESRVVVVDSVTAAGAMGLVVLAASGAARSGGSAAAVADRAREARANLKMWFVPDTLEYLRRGGRIGGAQAWLGSALRIKPILTFEAEVTPVERVRTSGRAFERMVEFLQSRHDEGADGWVVQHIQAPDQAEKLVERGLAIFGTDPAFVSEIGPVLGTHAGPGLLGVGGIPARLLA